MENSCGLLLQTIEKRALQFEGQWLLEQVENRSSFAGLIGGSEAMRKVYRAIEAVAGSMANVVIRGESGVGKELVARAIVQGGERRDQPYICLNCSALPKGMRRVPLQARDSAKPGMVEAAHAGTLFLDEITTLNHGLQSKLLRVLQGRTVQRLGGRTAKRLDFRLITATNDDLEAMVRMGRFREDLYYRINVVPIIA